MVLTAWRRSFYYANYFHGRSQSQGWKGLGSVLFHCAAFQNCVNCLWCKAMSNWCMAVALRYEVKVYKVRISKLSVDEEINKIKMYKPQLCSLIE